MIVEDDKKIREELGIFLSKNGYEVKKIEVFDNIVEEIIGSNSDLVLLDINLPNYDGFYICKEVRKKSKIPIIVVTSKNSTLDELMSINLGADDFITKPYNTQILLARIESVLRRIHNVFETKNIIEYKGIKVDISKSTLEFKNKKVELTKNELKILNFLLEKKGEIISRDQLMIYLWDSQMFIDDNTLTVNINRLRKKIEEIDVKDFIQTRRGQGYIIL